MTFFLSLLGMVGAFFMIKYREFIGSMIGEAAWMTKVGGVYNVVVIVAVFIFFWSLATMTGTTDILFSPLLWLLPGTRGQADF